MNSRTVPPGSTLAWSANPTTGELDANETPVVQARVPIGSLRFTVDRLALGRRGTAASGDGRTGLTRNTRGERPAMKEIDAAATHKTATQAAQAACRRRLLVVTPTGIALPPMYGRTPGFGSPDRPAAGGPRSARLTANDPSRSALEPAGYVIGQRRRADFVPRPPPRTSPPRAA